MPYNPAIHHRRSIRLKGYDYTQPGAYFVTLVTSQRECLFGSIQEGEMTLSPSGGIVAACWQRLPASFPIHLDEWIIMPDHLHAILLLDPLPPCVRAKHPPIEPLNLPDSAGRMLRPNGTQPGSLGAILQNFKSVSTRKINQARQSPGIPVWQRNYYEYIIRDTAEWTRIRQYIQDNPRHWAQDADHA